MKAPSRSLRAEREFGLLVGAILAAFGLWWIYRGKFVEVRPWVVGAGALLVALGALRPAWLRRPLRAWMTLAELLSRVVTTLILLVVFFLIVTPIGVFKRLRGWDPLGRRARPAASYWLPYPERQRDPRHFEKMF